MYGSIFQCTCNVTDLFTDLSVFQGTCNVTDLFTHFSIFQCPCIVTDLFLCRKSCAREYFTQLSTVEPVIYDHPLVPVILVVNDRWSKKQVHFNAKGYVGPLNCGYKWKVVVKLSGRK